MYHALPRIPAWAAVGYRDDAEIQRWIEDHKGAVAPQQEPTT